MTLRAMLNLPPPADADDFDAKVEDVLRIRHGNIHLVRFGRRGQEQYGIDGFDPTAPPGRGVVWQSTIRVVDLQNKLRRDLDAMDRSGLTPQLYIYAVGSERDARLQQLAATLSELRHQQERCPVEVLFWNEIRQFILDRETLGKKWYPDLFPTAQPSPAAHTAARTSQLAAANAREVPAEEDSPKQHVWYMVQLARICGETTEAHLRELRRALTAGDSLLRGLKEWSNGETASIGRNWYYPNGKEANIGKSWYYPNGKEANIGKSWYYPNGREANIGNNWYYPNGTGGHSEAQIVFSALNVVDDWERELFASGLELLTGQPRRLAILDLLWYVRRNTGNDR